MIATAPRWGSALPAPGNAKPQPGRRLAIGLPGAWKPYALSLLQPTPTHAMSDVEPEQPRADSSADHDDDPELDQPSFPGGLSRREIGAGREFWQSQVRARGGLRFDALDGFLTALSLLPHPPPPAIWTPLALGPNLAVARDDDREQAVAWMYRFGTHVAQRVRLDPAVHQSSVLPEFDFLPQDDDETEDQAEIRTAQSWSAGAAAALALDAAGVSDIMASETLRAELAPFVLLGRAGPTEDATYTRKERLRLMRAAAWGAHRLWKHYQPIRERGGLRPQPVRAEPTPGRNDPCPCGSGRKFKVCHGAARH